MTTPDFTCIDISLKLDARLPIFPGDPKLEITPVLTLETGPCLVSQIVMGSHTGTHADAPAHFIKGGKVLSEIPLARFNGPAWVLALQAAPAIEPEALEAAWPSAATLSAAGWSAGTPIERVLFATPNSARWGKPYSFEGIQNLSLAAAHWLLARQVKLVGIDALSIETDTDGTFPVHHALLGAEVLLLEGLDLSEAPAGPYELNCLPLKLDTPDGGPVRAVLRPYQQP